MKFIISLLLVALPLIAHSQGERQTFDLRGASTIRINALLSDIKITTNDSRQIEVTQTVEVQGEPEPEMIELEVTRKDGAIILNQLKPNTDMFKGYWTNANSPKEDVVIVNGVQVSGTRTVKATLEISVPKGVQVIVSAEYGSIEATAVPDLVEANATYGSVTVVYAAAPRAETYLYSKYGAVDVSFPAKAAADLELITQYGELYTDRDIQINAEAGSMKEFYQKTVGSVNGGGAKLKCEAPYGDVYLRSN